MNHNEITPIQIAIRIVIIIVVIVILLLVSFAMVRFIPRVISSLGDFRSIFAGKERLEASLDEKFISEGDEAILSFRQIGGSDKGYYTVKYSCAHIDTDTNLEVSQGSVVDMIPCDETLILETAASSTVSHELVLRPSSDDVTYDQPIALTISHISGSSTLSSATETLTVTGDIDNEYTEATTTVPVTTTSKPVTTSKPTYTRPSSSNYSSAPANLVATLGNVSVDNNGVATLTFYVTNTGGQNSGAWAFNATLPRLGQTTFNSPYQSSIPPKGSSIMYLTFENAEAGDIDVYVQNSHLNVRLK